MPIRKTRWIAILVAAVAALVMLAGVGAWVTGLAAVERATGYLAPVFTPDGASVLAVRRDVRAIVTGFGHEFFTPPATVRIRSDRFALISIRLADGHQSVLESFPPSPLDGQRIKAYHGSIFGVPHAHIRFADAAHADYEIAVTRHDSPLARTFVARKIWNPSAGAYAATAAWQETSTGMSGDVPQQIHGALEVMAVPGDELMPCAIGVFDRDRSTVTIVVETSACQRKYPHGITAAVLTPLSRRAEIERAEKIRSTYAALVEKNRASGASEGQAMLDAGRQMQRLGLYPSTPTLVAAPVDCAAGRPVFSITDDEFRYGLFQDIEAAIGTPGSQVDKDIGSYITHRDYTTSRAINEYLAAGHRTFVVRARDRCWRLTVQRP